MTSNPGTTANGGQDITFFFVSRGCVTVSHTCSLYIELQPQSKFKSTVKANKIMPSQWSKVEFLNPQSKSKEIVIKSHVKGSITLAGQAGLRLWSQFTVSMRVVLRLYCFSTVPLLQWPKFLNYTCQCENLATSVIRSSHYEYNH